MRYLPTKLSIMVMAVAIGTATMSQADNDKHSDGAAAVFGAVQLERWANHPDTPAKIAQLTAGKAYVAERLKLAPGQYSWAQMAQIAAAGSNQSARAVTMMKLQGDRPMNAAHSSQGEQSLAKSLGVLAEDYTLSELAKMKFSADF